jgi:hypothetical protein
MKTFRIAISVGITFGGLIIVLVTIFVLYVQHKFREWMERKKSRVMVESVVV